MDAAAIVTAPSTRRPVSAPNRLPQPVIDGWRNRVFVWRHQLEAVIDGAFAELDVRSGVSITVYNEADSGLGDVAFASKFMALLDRELPGVSLDLVSTDAVKQAGFGLPSRVRLWSVADYAGRGPMSPPQLVISAPGIFDHCRSAASVLNTLHLPLETPFLFLAEYGSIRQLRDDAFKSLEPQFDAFIDSYLDRVAAEVGVEPDVIGHRPKTGEIVVVGDGQTRVVGNLALGLLGALPGAPLRAWVLDPCLAARSCGIEAGELGVHLDDGLLARARELAEDPAMRQAELAQLADAELRVALQDDPDSGKYLGYGHSGAETFLDYVALLEQRHSRSIDVVMPTSRSPEQLAAVELGLALRERLRGRGIGVMEILGGDPRQPAAQVSPVRLELGPGKRLRVFVHYPLCHEDMRRLLLATEPATMVSGDQSFSDAVSARKAVVYIEPVYCQTWHMDAVCALADRVAPPARTVLAFGMQYEWSEQGYGPVAEILSGPDPMAPFLAMNDAIWANHNLNPAVMAMVRRQLATAAHPEMAVRVREFLRAAVADLDIHAGLLLDPAELQRLAEDVTRLASSVR